MLSELLNLVNDMCLKKEKLDMYVVLHKLDLMIEVVKTQETIERAKI